MTIKELSQLYWLTREIEQDKARLEELYCLSIGTGQYMAGLPHVSGITDNVAKYAAEIADLKGVIEARVLRCQEEKIKLENYIDTISDSVTRRIFVLRFSDGLSWDQVAACVGGGNTYGSVKQRVFRFIRKSSLNVTA